MQRWSSEASNWQGRSKRVSSKWERWVGEPPGYQKSGKPPWLHKRNAVALQWAASRQWLDIARSQRSVSHKLTFTELAQ
jgi:hypothetical protein